MAIESKGATRRLRWSGETTFNDENEMRQRWWCTSAAVPSNEINDVCANEREQKEQRKKEVTRERKKRRVEKKMSQLIKFKWRQKQSQRNKHKNLRTTCAIRTRQRSLQCHQRATQKKNSPNFESTDVATRRKFIRYFFFSLALFCFGRSSAWRTAEAKNEQQREDKKQSEKKRLLKKY